MTRSHIKPTKQGNKNSRGEGVSKKLRVEGFGKQYRECGFQGVRNLLSTMTEVEMNDFNKIIGRNYKSTKWKKVSETLLLKQERATLNAQKQSIPLKLLNLFH